MRDKKVLVLAEIGLAVALAAVLGFIQVMLPININGGSISLSMLPIVVVALRRGPLAGAVSGGLYGCMDLVLGKAFILHWAQVLLDYPLPYLLLGLFCGFFSTLYLRQMADKAYGKASGVALFAIFIGCLGRYAAHLTSGAIFFATYIEGMDFWVYNIIYNASYLLPSMIAVMLLTLVVLPAVHRAVPPVADAATKGAPEASSPSTASVSAPAPDPAVATSASTQGDGSAVDASAQGR